MATILDSPELGYFRENLTRFSQGRVQAELADAAKITRVHLNRILKGHASPTLPVAANLARALQVPLTTLLTDPSLFDSPKNSESEPDRG
jgi:transcriptional regulator with XRE-family HTH domain